ncbi:hypothetical protein BY996DRAFT_6515058 [Phakopsora pachyrhizi]|nr:hypothetical protein BY996DRAFT_6515058 [Phakopsora pachyrhizi]
MPIDRLEDLGMLNIIRGSEPVGDLRCDPVIHRDDLERLRLRKRWGAGFGGRQGALNAALRRLNEVVSPGWVVRDGVIKLRYLHSIRRRYEGWEEEDDMLLFGQLMMIEMGTSSTKAVAGHWSKHLGRLAVAMVDWADEEEGEGDWNMGVAVRLERRDGGLRSSLRVAQRFLREYSEEEVEEEVEEEDDRAVGVKEIGMMMLLVECCSGDEGVEAEGMMRMAGSEGVGVRSGCNDSDRLGMWRLEVVEPAVLFVRVDDDGEGLSAGVDESSGLVVPPRLPIDTTGAGTAISRLEVKVKVERMIEMFMTGAIVDDWRAKMPRVKRVPDGEILEGQQKPLPLAYLSLCSGESGQVSCSISLRRRHSAGRRHPPDQLLPYHQKVFILTEAPNWLSSPVKTKSNQAIGNNSSGHLTSDDYAIICAWLSRPSNYSSCFGKPGSTTIGQPPASKENGFNLMAYQSSYGKAKKKSSSTGFGLKEEDQRKGIITISQKLNLMFPSYEQMDHIFGWLPKVNPLGGGDHKQHTWSLPQITNESTDEDGEDIDQPAMDSDIITNDIPVPPLATPINTSTSQKTSNSWNLNPNSHKKTSESALPPTTYEYYCRNGFLSKNKEPIAIMAFESEL